MSQQVIDFMQQRRSVVAKKMLPEAPADDALNAILQIGLRVPDHSNVQPWRIVVLKGEARKQFSEQVIVPAARKRCEEDSSIQSGSDMGESLEQVECNRMQRGGVVIAVLFKPTIPHKIPVWEQQLSAGAVCAHILLAAQAYDYAAQWLTEWPAYDKAVIESLGGDAATDLVAGFIHIGRKAEQPNERKRPVPEDIISYWTSS
ncbi:hypothetical protein AB833_05870 [Chromatiales bacterium (ex Bugula neritina AB1)]|nr:hypothetical protein AB833_05870 [Chromatiales bacterium (ex Bugula neritina AB1)]